MKNADLLQTASEQFLGKKEHEIKSTVLQTLEGHLRAILGEFHNTINAPLCKFVLYQVKFLPRLRKPRLPPKGGKRRMPPPPPPPPPLPSI